MIDRCLLDEQSLGSVDDVVRSQAVVEPAGVRTDNFSDGGSESDDVVANFGFDLCNAGDVEVGAFANGAGGVLGDHACFCQSFGGGDFNSEPGAETILIAPDAAHVGTGVAWDQGCLPDDYQKCGTRDCKWVLRLVTSRLMAK